MKNREIIAKVKFIDAFESGNRRAVFAPNTWNPVIETWLKSSLDGNVVYASTANPDKARGYKVDYTIIYGPMDAVGMRQIVHPMTGGTIYRL